MESLFFIAFILACVGVCLGAIKVLDKLFGPQVKLRGSGKFRHDVVGENSYQNELNSIAGGKTAKGHNLKVTAKLYFEDDNPYDCDAVRVDIKGKTVGYLAADRAPGFRKRIAKDFPGRYRSIVCRAVIVGGWNRGRGDIGSYGVRLDL